MWKVIIIVCTLGNPCVIMEEDPIKHYQDYNECMKVAEIKHNELVDSFSLYGFVVENSEFKGTGSGKDSRMWNRGSSLWTYTSHRLIGHDSGH